MLWARRQARTPKPEPRSLVSKANIVGLRAEAVVWFGYAATVVAACILLLELRRFLRATLLYARLPLAEMRDTFWFSVRHDGILGFFQPFLLTGLTYGVCQVAGIELPTIIFVPPALLQLFCIVRSAMPASILFLATSRREALRLYTRLSRGIWPYRIVLLLDPASVEVARHSGWQWMGFLEDNLRQPAGEDWRHAVRRIAATVPVIVIDARTNSPALVEEVKHMFSLADHADKTIVVCHGDGSAPAVTAASLDARAVVYAVREEEVVDVLRNRGLIRTESPDEMPFVAALNCKRSLRAIRANMGLVAEQVEGLRTSVETRRHPRNVAFIATCQELLNRLDGGQNDGALEVICELDADIAATDRALLSAVGANADEAEAIVRQLHAVRAALGKLQQAVDATSPECLDTIRDTVWSNRFDRVQ